MRHNFGVAEIANVVILCVNEMEVPDACVTGPLVRAKADKSRDTFTIPEGRKQQVVSTLGKNWPKDGLMSITCRSRRCAADVRFGSKADVCGALGDVR
jgi:hypothetical protein